MKNDFLKKLNNVSKVVKRMPDSVAKEAVRFSKERFQQTNWIGDTTENWKKRKFDRKGNNVLTDSSRLRTSIKAVKKTLDVVVIGTDVPYARIHNTGGRIKVTPKMIKFFWAKYYETSGTLTETKKGAVSKTQRNAKIQSQAGYWKSLALMKPGKEIKIPKRQFIGSSPYLEKRLIRIMSAQLNKAL